MNIVPYEPSDKDALLAVWERSVLATHHFLSPEDIASIKDILTDLDYSQINITCLKKEGQLLGFLGMHDDKIEMLFLDPNFIGQGLGQLLINFALERGARKVDVNEQNEHAMRFYEKAGFSVYERTEKDALGMDYPILKMQRS